MDNYLVSIIVPVYNPGEHLRKCLDSLIMQTYRNLEIVLIDDGSKDGSYEICKEYAQKDSRIVLIHQENRGVSHARNVGIDNSHGDYYSFIDSDDYLDLDTYEYLLGQIEKHKADIVNYEHYITFPDHEIKHRLNDDAYGMFDKKGAQRQLLFNVQFACNKLFPKRTIDGLRFDESIFRGEDTLFARLAFDRAERFWFDDRPLYHYVQSGESAVRGAFRKSQLSIVKLYDIYIPFYSTKYPELLSGFYGIMAGQLIGIYFDMWSDDNDYRKEQDWLRGIYNKYYALAISNDGLSLKNKIKYRVFRYAPAMFCKLHKRIWKK